MRPFVSRHSRQSSWTGDTDLCGACRRPSNSDHCQRVQWKLKPCSIAMDHFPVYILAANIVTANGSAISGAATSDTVFKLYTHPDNELISIVCFSLHRCDLSACQLLFEHLHVGLLVSPDYLFKVTFVENSYMYMLLMGIYCQNKRSTYKYITVYIYKNKDIPFLISVAKWLFEVTTLCWPVISAPDLLKHVVMSWLLPGAQHKKFLLLSVPFQEEKKIVLRPSRKNQVLLVQGLDQCPLKGQQCHTDEMTLAYGDPSESNVHSTLGYVAPIVANSLYSRTAEALVCPRWNRTAFSCSAATLNFTRLCIPFMHQSETESRNPDNTFWSW